MRRKDREMPRKFALEVTDRCNYGTVAMIYEGEPYAVALNLVRSGDALYFHCAKEGKKIDALRKNPQVWVSFVASECPEPEKFTTKYQSASVCGTAEELVDPSEKTEALRLLCEKLAPSNMHSFGEAIERSLEKTAVWRINIEKITAKSKR